MDIIKDYFQTVKDACQEAGNAIMTVYQGDISVAYKKDTSPLTVADQKSHDIIKEKLSKTDLPILSEEGRDLSFAARNNWNLFWLVDPLDGTKEFIKKNDEFTINIALIQKNNPILGFVYLPVKKLLYYGGKNKGAYKIDFEKGDTPIEIPNNPLPQDFTIVGSRSHQTPELLEYVENQKKRHNKVHFVSAGSAMKFCLMAENKAHVYPRLGPTMEWDTAAGQGVCEGAGLSVHIYNSRNTLNYNKENLLNPWFIVSNKSSSNGNS